MISSARPALVPSSARGKIHWPNKPNAIAFHTPAFDILPSRPLFYKTMERFVAGQITLSLGGGEFSELTTKPYREYGNKSDGMGLLYLRMQRRAM